MQYHFCIRTFVSFHCVLQAVVGKVLCGDAIIMHKKSFNAFIFQLLGGKPCKTFRRLKTKDFSQRYLDSRNVSLKFLDVYIKNLAISVR